VGVFLEEAGHEGRRIEGETTVRKMGRARLAVLGALVAGAGVAACGTQSATGSAEHATLVTSVAARWQIERTPQPAGTISAALTSVACPSAVDCVAVGSYGTASSGGALLERWNGAHWSIERAPVPAGANSQVSLDAVSCTSVDSCLAIGDSPIVDTTTKAFADVWNGRSWRLVGTPVPKGDQGTYLVGVSCTSAVACTAVGSGEYVSHHFGMTATLAESWNGRSWSIVPTPNPSVAVGGGNDLVSVSCASPRACMAIGEGDGSTADRVLAEWWNGSTWKLEPSPTLSEGDGLVDVSCPTASSCTAVGAGSGAPTPGGFVEGWNGSSWTVEATPPVASGGADLSGISCASSSDCVAVGLRSASSGGSDTLAELWNGSSWAVVPTPDAVHGNPGPTTTTPTTGTVEPTDQNDLASVACSAPTACTAVGSDLGAYDVGAALVERYSN
jgi:hypothetical protein